MKNLFVFALILTGLMMMSCGDDSGPVITITAPTEGATFSAGDDIAMTGTVTDDVEVSTMTIAVSDGILATTDIDFSTITDKTNVPLTGVEITLNDMTPAGDYTITVSATDDEGNTSSEDVGITVQ